MKTSKAFPHNLEAERALLGSILLDNKALSTAQESLSARDFFGDQNRLIFMAMQKLAEEQTTIDLVTLSMAISDGGNLEKCGGAGYLAALTDGIPIGVAASLREYCRIIKEKSDLRRLIHIANSITTDAFEHPEYSTDPEALLESAISRFAEFDAGRDGERPAVTFREAAGSLLRKLDAKDLLRVDFGLRDLDGVVGGALAGELVVIAAETGAGKTLLAEQVRRYACRHGQHGIYASGEMSKELLSARELGTSSGIERWKLRYPEKITSDDWQSLARAAGQECEVCRIMDGEITMARVAAWAERMNHAGELKFICVDYDELVAGPGRDELERQAVTVRSCHNLAGRFQVPVFLLSQLRKVLQGESRRRPNLDQLFGSRAKSKYATTVLYIWRKYIETFAKEDKTQAAIAVLKNRNGLLGSVPQYFDPQSLMFRDLLEDERSALAAPPKRETKKDTVGLPYKDD